MSATISGVRVGARNLLTDIDGLKVGQAADARARTGVTLIVPDQAAVGAVASSGGGPGTRETDALSPANLVQHVDGVVLAGGSVYGLEAASELTQIMGAQGRGFATGAPLPSPIIPAAILFDMSNGGDKNWGAEAPYRACTRTAYGALAQDFALGNHGAGYGAQAGTLKGGIGSASAITNMPHEIKVGALMAVNALGSVCDEQGHFWAHYLALPEDDIPNAPPNLHAAANPLAGSKIGGLMAGGNTSIGVVATNADLTRAEAMRVAIMAQDGLARAVRPIHTPFDGDTIFVLATGTQKLAEDAALRPAALCLLGAMAADCVSRAVCRGVLHGDTLGAMHGYHACFKK